MPSSKPKIFIFTFFTLTVVTTSLYILFCIHQKPRFEQKDWFMYQEVFAKVSKKHSKVNTIFLGDSRLKSIVKIKANELNFTLPGISPIEGYIMLKRYLKQNNNPNRIVLSFAPYHLIQTRYFFNRSISYGFLNKGDLDSIYSSATQLKDTHFDTYNYYKTKYLPNTYYGKIKQYFLEHDYNKKIEFQTQLQISQGHVFFGKQQGNSELNDESYITNNPYSKTISKYFNQLLKLCKERNIQVLYYIAPMNHTSCKKIEESFFTTHQSYLIELGLTSIHPLECWSDQLFGDSNHLYLGANKANDRLRHFIKSN